MDIEVLMYKIMNSMYNMNAPIVFKGAMVLKAIQYSTGNPSGLTRETHDLDGDWIDGKPSMGYLQGVLQYAVNNAGYNNVTVKAEREYGDKKSAGFGFYDCNDKLIVSMDLSIRPNNMACRYSFVNGINFYGQDVTKILSDKILVCSTNRLMRRVKDVIDLYILSYSWSGYNTDIVYALNKSGNVLDNFDRFLNNVDDLRHAYSKYRNKASVLDFDVVYKRVLCFLRPFIMRNNCKLYWNGSDWVNG